MLNFRFETKQEKIVAAAVVALIFVAAVFLVYAFQKMRQTGVEDVKVEQPLPQTTEEKQKNMLNAVEKANEDGQAVSPAEQSKEQQDMLNAVEKANEKSVPVSNDEQSKMNQDMLNALNALNDK
jgi:hypothetical protein